MKNYFSSANAAFTRSSGERRGWDILLKEHKCQRCRPDTHAILTPCPWNALFTSV